jgi:hypothetical protein
MALPEGVWEHAIRVPTDRPLVLRARISDPPAVFSDSYLGGFASGHRLVYADAREFVWWAADAPAMTGYGSGAYGAGPYGEAAPATGYGSQAYGAGPYGEAASADYGGDNYGRGPYGG